MVKRYDAAPGGGMMERSGGKYFHERDVEDLIIVLDCASSFIKAMREIIGGEPTGTELDVIDTLREWKDESV